MEGRAKSEISPMHKRNITDASVKYDGEIIIVIIYNNIYRGLSVYAFATSCIFII